MKKLLASTILATTVLCNLPAYAQMNNTSTQNMSQPSMDIMTIEQVQGLGDNAPVMLEGMIIQSLGDEKYTFQDPSGATIIVEIDDEDWKGLKPTPQDVVIITGETDKNGNITEIDVETIMMKQ